MMIETIPLKVFMAAGPSPATLSLVDGGLTFFIGTGACLLGLIALEKLGVSVNETTVRVIGWMGVLIAFVVFVLKNPLFRGLAFGW
jgi:uncharacterized membrane protein